MFISNTLEKAEMKRKSLKYSIDFKQNFFFLNTMNR